MSKGVKIALIVVSALLATCLLSGVAGYFVLKKNGPKWQAELRETGRKVHAEGEAAGEGATKDDCVRVAVERFGKKTGLVDRVSRRLRAAGRTAATVTLRIRFDDFTSSTTSHTLPRPTAHTQVLLDATLQLLRSRRADVARRGITLVGFQASGLDTQGEQLLLPLSAASDPGLDSAVDAVRDRFGTRAVRRGAQLGRGERAAMPILPDE